MSGLLLSQLIMATAMAHGCTITDFRYDETHNSYFYFSVNTAGRSQVR